MIKNFIGLVLHSFGASRVMLGPLPPFALCRGHAASFAVNIGLLAINMEAPRTTLSLASAYTTMHEAEQAASTVFFT